MRIRELMQTDVVTVDAAAHLEIAEGLMRMDRIRHLPVVSGGTLYVVSKSGQLLAFR